MATYGVEYLNGVTIAVEAKNREAAKRTAEEMARTNNWPSTTAVRTWLYGAKGILIRPQPKPAKRPDVSEGDLFGITA
jgi:hypothetical protein